MCAILTSASVTARLKNMSNIGSKGPTNGCKHGIICLKRVASQCCNIIFVLLHPVQKRRDTYFLCLNF